MTRIGSNKPQRVDVRVVAATNEHLPRLVDEGRFRADLLDRLSFEVVTLPPLRAREGDIAVLADHFGRRMAAELEWDGWPGFAADALVALETYDWPGNVRELRNVVERSVYRWDGGTRLISHIEFDPFASPWQPPVQPKAERAPEPPGRPPAELPARYKDAVAAFERSLLEEALARHRHNQRAAARALDLTYDQLRHALRRTGLL